MSRRRSRHGLSPVKTKVMVRGLKAVNLNSAAARAFVEHRSELIEALGGQDQVSPQIRGLVEMASRLRLVIDHGYAWLYEHGGQAINGRRRGFIPLVRELMALSEAYVRILDRLGLARLEPKEATLGEIVADIVAKREAREAAQEQSGAGTTGMPAPEAVLVEPGVAAVTTGPSDEAPEGRMVAAAADQAARRVLGTWVAVEPERAGPEVEVPAF